MNNVTMGFSLISIPPLSLRPGIARGARHARRALPQYPDRPHERGRRHDGDLRAAYPSGAVVMAFYAGGAMPGELQATHLLAVVEVVEASRVIEFHSQAGRP